MTLLFSTIIPTIGRSTLSRAVRSVLEQQFDPSRFEIIVVNDSARPLAEEGWHHSPQLQIIETNHRERSTARNTGAAIAQGQYLHFLDDDDWLLPKAFQHFWELAEKTKAAMLYGGYYFVDLNGNILEECHPNEEGNCFVRFMSGEWQPLQASVFESNAFHAIGGFLPLHVLRGGDEDVDLTRRISLQHDTAGTNELIASICISRENSTTNYTNLQEQSRQSRELILSQPAIFSRLRDSARQRSEYWYGRISWIYLSSAAWNLKQKKISTTISRLLYFLGAFFISYRYWFSWKFWRGAALPHQAHGLLV